MAMNKRLFMRFPSFKDKALTLSYDDGTIYDRQLVGVFLEHGLKGTFNLCSSFVSKKKAKIFEIKFS